MESQQFIASLHQQAEEIEESAAMSFQQHEHVMTAMTQAMMEKADDVKKSIDTAEKKTAIMMSNIELGLEDCVDNGSELDKRVTRLESTFSGHIREILQPPLRDS